MVRLANKLLEPIRELLGVALIVHSGYRNPEVSQAVGGGMISVIERALSAGHSMEEVLT